MAATMPSSLPSSPLFEAEPATRPLTPSPVSASKSASESAAPNTMPKPFFLMDWLEDLIQDHDAEKIAEMLQTPEKSCKAQDECPSTPKSSNRRRTKSSPSLTAAKDAVASIRTRGKSCSTSKKQNDLSPPNMERKRLDRQLFPTTRSLPSLSAAARVAASDTAPKASTPKPGRSNKSHLGTPPLPKNCVSVTSSYSLAAQTPMAWKRRSPFFQKSVQLGNGWNAKGLKKAKQALWQDALSCWDNALEIRLQVLGVEHVDVANTYNNRGIALGKLGQWEGALQSLQLALQIRTKMLGQHHVQVAATIHNLANVHHQAGDLEGAIQLLAQAKQIQQTLADAEEPAEAELKRMDDATSAAASPLLEVARASLAMGHVYYEAQQFLDAKEAYRDALDVCLRSVRLPLSDPQVQEIQHDLRQLERLLIVQEQAHQRQMQLQQIELERRSQCYYQTQALAYPSFSKDEASDPTSQYALQAPPNGDILYQHHRRCSSAELQSPTHRQHYCLSAQSPAAMASPSRGMSVM